MNSMRTLYYSISLITIVAVASQNAAAAASSSNLLETLEEAVAASNRKRLGFTSRQEGSRKPLLDIPKPEPSANDPQTLEEAMAASNRKRLGILSRDAGSRKPLLAKLKRDESSANDPQTLEEAMAASNRKRLDVRKQNGELTVDIVDRREERLHPLAAKQALRRNNGGRESLTFLTSIEESGHAQSITIQTREGTPEMTEETSNGVIPDFEAFEPSVDRRADEIAGGQFGSGGILCGGASVAAWATAIGLFIAQVW